MSLTNTLLILKNIRTFQLFDMLDIKTTNNRLIPYFFKDELNVCPTYFNDVHTVGTPKDGSIYKMNEGLAKDDQIPQE